jgi:transcriptional regulator with XRE-family HTH domain
MRNHKMPQKAKRLLVRRYEYARISGADLAEALQEAGLTPEEFSRLTGTGSPQRIAKWLKDEEDIPHDAHLLISIFVEQPTSLQIAREMAEGYARTKTWKVQEQCSDTKRKA